MEIKAKVKYIRMSPRKVRLVADIIRGLETNKALDTLKFTNKKAVKPVKKLMDSVIANAVNNYGLDKNNLYIKEIKVNEGSTLHRWMPRAHGRATPIRKRTSHIDIVLDEIKKSGVKKAKKREVEAPVRLDKKAVKVTPKAKEIKIKEDRKRDKDIKLKEVLGNRKVKKEETEEKGKKIIDPRMEGHGGHSKIEGKSHKGFINRIFRRKSG